MKTSAKKLMQSLKFWSLEKHSTTHVLAVDFRRASVVANIDEFIIVEAGIFDDKHTLMLSIKDVNDKIWDTISSYHVNDKEF